MSNIIENSSPVSSQPLPVLSLDWLQLYCTGHLSDNSFFTFKLEEYQTRHFKKVYTIFYEKKIVGFVTAIPHSQILNPLTLIIKFENSLLYSSMLQVTIEKLLKTCKLKFQSITRCDIAIDFQNFYNNYAPEQFIRDFFQDIVLKNGRAKFTTYGTHNLTNSYSYLKFGSRTSSHLIYLYNKSLEMREIKTKPWVEEFWKKNNIISPPDTWRLEFSFKGSQNKIVDSLTGEISKINLTTLFSNPHLINLMNTAISQLFHFKINDNTKNKTRMQDLKLFENIQIGTKLLKIPETKSPLKTEKLLLKKLVHLAQETKNTDSTSFYFYNQTIYQLSILYNLRKYVRTHLNYIIHPQILYV